MLLETDEQLIQKALQGDRLARERLIAPHRKMVVATAYHALGNADDANDVAQEALLYALQRLSDLRDRRKFPAWLRNITLTLCTDYRRRRGTRRLGEPMTLLNERSEETDYTERLAVREALTHLSDDHRTAVLMHYVGGWTREEMAQILDIPMNTVRSRLMAAKSHLRTDLLPFFDSRKTMTTKTLTLSKIHSSLINNAFPNATILSVKNDPEPWMPFSPRVELRLSDGTEKTVDFRGDLDPTKLELFAVLEQNGIACPRPLLPPVANGNNWVTLCEVPRGDNLLLWALGGTPHRVRLATERAFEAIDKLQGATDALLADPVGQKIERRSLTDEIEYMKSAEKWATDAWLRESGQHAAQWRTDPWFVDALNKVESAVADIHDPLVLTNYLHFFPNFVRIEPAVNLYNEPLGWPGDIRYAENPLVEFTVPYGHLGDPLLGLAMVWVYDCYPFVHTGYVEQFLWRRGISRREFAPRLAIKALQMVMRDLPVEHPADGNYYDALRGWVDQALGWMS